MPKPPATKAAILSKAAATIRDLSWDAATEYESLELALVDLGVRKQKAFLPEMAKDLERLKQAYSLMKAVKMHAIDLWEQAEEIKNGR